MARTHRIAKAIANHDVELAELGFAHFKLALDGRVADPRLWLVRRAGKGSGGEGSRRPIPAVARSARATRPSGADAAAGNAHHRSHRTDDATQGDRRCSAAQAALLELNQLRGAPRTNRHHGPPEPGLHRPRRRTFRWRHPGTTSSCGCDVWSWRSKASKSHSRGTTVSPPLGPTSPEERAGDREEQVGVGVSLPLPLWNRNGGNIDSAKARQKQAEISLDVTQRDVERRKVESP